MYNSGWFTTQLENVKSAALAYRGRECLDLLRRRGLDLKPGNRLSKAVGLLEETNTSGAPAVSERLRDPAFQIRLAENWRTVWEMFVVAHAISQRRASSRVLTNELLQCFLEGAELPADDRNPAARNCQFEAITAAQLVQSGVGISRDEPDFVFDFLGGKAGLAVKRLTSVKATKVYDELRDAATQLQKASLRGFASLSVDNWVSDLGTDRDPEAVGALFNAQVQEAHKQLDKISLKQQILGVFLSVNWYRWDIRDDKPYLQWAAPQQIVCYSDATMSDEQFASFFDPVRARWEASLRALVRLVS